MCTLFQIGSKGADVSCRWHFAIQSELETTEPVPSTTSPLNVAAACRCLAIALLFDGELVDKTWKDPGLGSTNPKRTFSVIPNLAAINVGGMIVRCFDLEGDDDEEASSLVNERMCGASQGWNSYMILDLSCWTISAARFPSLQEGIPIREYSMFALVMVVLVCKLLLVVLLLLVFWPAAVVLSNRRESVIPKL